MQAANDIFGKRVAALAVGKWGQPFVFPPPKGRTLKNDLGGRTGHCVFPMMHVMMCVTEQMNDMQRQCIQ